MNSWVRANKGFLMFLVLFEIFRTAIADQAGVAWLRVPGEVSDPR